MEYNVISADDHIDMQWLPRDLWTGRVESKFRDEAPHVIDTDDGPHWVCAGKKLDVWGIPKNSGRRNAGRRNALERAGVLEDGVMRPTTPALRLEDMDRDGIDAQTLYGPIIPIFIKDRGLRRASYRAYNEWLAEFCSAAPERFVGAGLVPVDDPQRAAEAVWHLHELGVRGASFLAARVTLPLWDDEWEPLWEVAEECGIPLGFHLGGGYRTVVLDGPKAEHIGNMGVRLSCVALQLDEPLVGVIFSGALARHPGLKIVLAESGIGWLPYILETMDEHYSKFRDAREYWQARGGFNLEMPPSEYFKRQVWATFQEDSFGIQSIDANGPDRVLWASDYPHGASTWPNSQEVIRRNLARLAPAIRRQVLCENARMVYGL